MALPPQRAVGTEQITLSAIAVVIGLLAGYGAILFRNLIDLFQWLFMGEGGDNVVTLVAELPAWRIWLIPVMGGAAIGMFNHWIAKNLHGGHGVPEVMAAVALHGGKLDLRAGLLKIVACAISIGGGASVGREGPVVNLGATIASWVGQRFKLSVRQMRTMVGCGAAAGIAASFNAPIAGVIFSLEVILGEYGLATFSPIVLSAVIATVVARNNLGDYPAFITYHHTLVSAWEIPAYVGLGVVCGLVGIAFMITLFALEDHSRRLKIPAYLRPILGGAAVGTIAIFFPEVMGVGYDTMNRALLEQMAVGTMFALVILKILATAISLASGFSGGVFTPALFLGAMVGGVFGTHAHALFPALSAGPGAYTMVGMGAMSAAVLGAPITSILIMFELTGDYRIMLAMMVAAIVASLLINQLYGDSVFTRALRRNNLDLWSGPDSCLLRSLKVKDVMRQDCEVIPESFTIRKLKQKFRNSRLENFLVVDHDGNFKGFIAFNDIRGVAFEEGVEELVQVREVTTSGLPTLLPDDDLFTALRKMGGMNLDLLPVVDATTRQRVVGVITNADLLRAYHRALEERSTDR